MKLKTAKRKFKAQWLAFKYTNEAKDEGQVLLHDKDRKALYKKLDLKKAGGKVYVTYTGPLIPKEYSILFRANP